MQASQVHRVLREAAGPEHAHGDRERLVCGDPGIDESAVHLGELGPAEHLVHCDDASGELAESARGQPAYEVLGEHREALLSLLVTGQTAGQYPELLVRAVDEGDDVGADFVVQQCFGPSRRDPSGGRDEQVAVGDHHPGASNPNLDVRLDVGGERPVPVQLGLGELHERVGIEPRARIGSWCRHRGEDGLGFVQEGGGDRAVLLDAQREELGRTTTRQHLHQEQQLTMLRLQQVRHGRVLDVAHRDLLDAGGSDRRVVAEGPVLEFRCSASGPERLSRFDEVDRGDVEEEAEARGDVGKRPIDREVRIGQRRYGHVGAGHRRSSMSAGTTAASAPRSCSRWCSSRSPVHSSMNTFLNSIASAQPVPS